MQSISFSGRITKIGTTYLTAVPLELSKAFSTRGMLMIEGRVANSYIHCPLEPDGRGSHWLKIDDLLLRSLKFKAGDSVKVEIWESDKWFDPLLPEDFVSALSENALHAHWDTLTYRAKWEWLRWINSSAIQSTRVKRIATAVAKLHKGDKRPCCFNSRMCTDISVSKAGLLDEDS